MRTAVLILLSIFLAASATPQGMPDSILERKGLDELMSLLNLRQSDFTFRDDYTQVDSFRLTTIANLMRHPYGMIEFVEQYRDTCLGIRPEPILNFAFDNLALVGQTERGRGIDRSEDSAKKAGMNLFYKSEEFNRLFKKVHHYLYDVFPPSADSTFAGLAKKEKNFLLNEFKQLLTEDTADEHRPVDQLDSIQKVEEEYTRQFVKFGTMIRKDFLVAAGIEASVDLLREIYLLNAEFEAAGTDIDKMLKDTVGLPSKPGIGEFLGRNKRWAIGGSGDNTYKGEYDFIIDFGGNDRYDLKYSPDSPHGTIIIDLAGSDIYNAMTDFALASGCMSAGLLFDMQGDDIYNGKDFSCGSGYFGFGLLFDASGHDKYIGDTHIQGSGTFGMGILIDEGGNDEYTGALYAQGFGGPEGWGSVIDYSGNDVYIAGNKYKDVLRYADHYLSLSQGFAFGFRPYMSGGIGMIFDMSGNDNYISDIFAQGASYWWSLGAIYDSSGNDQYMSFQYAQGTATHMSLGILVDQSGNDFYFGKGLMQGCGHDYSCGIILDRNGDDFYRAYDLSQGAGSANGFGILIDDFGDDAYYVMRKNNTQGFGDPRRDFGSIGLFLDMAGVDKYDGNGGDNLIWQTPSKWGGGMDWEFTIPDSLKAEK